MIFIVAACGQGVQLSYQDVKLRLKLDGILGSKFSFLQSLVY